RRASMKVGIALNMLSEPPRPDVAVVSDHLAMGDLAEPLGFDSLFALEHHFTGYAMSPAPLQLLAYFAGRTKRITFGTAVIVLPWHDPIRVAEEIALLDILSGGRCLFGFGRGAAHVDPAAADLPSRRTLLRLVDQPGIGRDHGQARLWHIGGHAKRMAEGRREHHQLPRDRTLRRKQPAAADHPAQRLLRREPGRGPGPGDELARQEMAVDRRPLPFLRWAPRHGQRL